MKIEIEIPDLHEIAKRELKEKGFMQSIQKTKEATHKLIEDQGISAIALIIAETLDQVLEHRELPVIGLHEEAESIS
jgi:hypothetical protein